MENQLRLQLEPRESLLVAQFLRYLVPDQQETHVSREFLMNFAVAFVNQVDERGCPQEGGKPEDIPISEEDLLSLRELIPVTGMVGNTPVGLIIHRKLYQGLLRYHPDHAAELHFSETEEPGREAFALELQQWKRRQRRSKK